MAYKSLYRKYRPLKFEDVYGQEFIIKTLSNAIKNNKIGHAYLFCGTRGTGKTTIAKIFARSVNCLKPLDNMPCGKCEICLNENTDEIPDIIEIDAASNNGVDEIRELKNKIKLVPNLCKYKVYIIDEVHMLSTGAFNALLKTLEEPPEHVIFILATTEPQKLPITIISRCQRFDFKKINISDIKERLKFIAKEEKIKIDDLALDEIAKISDGAMRDAIGLLDQISSFTDSKITLEDIYMVRGSVSYNTILTLLDNLVDNNIKELLDIIDEIYLSGKDFNRLAEDILLILRNILIFKVAPIYFKSKDIAFDEEIIKLSKKIERIQIEKLIFKFEELIRNIKNSNYPKVLFEITILSSLDLDTSNVIKEKELVIDKDVCEEDVNDSIVLKIENKNITEKEYIKSEEKNKVFTEKAKASNEIEVVKIDDKAKEALINNTIALASLSLKKNASEIFNAVDKYLIDKKYKIAAAILKDATISAISDDHILLTYKYDSMVEDNDKEYKLVSSLIKKMLNKEYKVVAISKSKWDEIRPYYVKLKKEKGSIPLLEEIYNEDIQVVDNQIEKEYEDILDLFGSELIEMEG